MRLNNVQRVLRFEIVIVGVFFSRTHYERGAEQVFLCFLIVVYAYPKLLCHRLVPSCHYRCAKYSSDLF